MGSEKEVELSVFMLTPERRLKTYRVESKTSSAELVVEQGKIRLLVEEEFLD